MRSGPAPDRTRIWPLGLAGPARYFSQTAAVSPKAACSTNLRGSPPWLSRARRFPQPQRSSEPPTGLCELSLREEAMTVSQVHLPTLGSGGVENFPNAYGTLGSELWYLVALWAAVQCGSPVPPCPGPAVLSLQTFPRPGFLRTGQDSAHHAHLRLTQRERRGQQQQGGQDRKPGSSGCILDGWSRHGAALGGSVGVCGRNGLSSAVQG